MSESPQPSPDPIAPSGVMLLLGTIADTTWRMFVPTIGCIVIGYKADMGWGTKPWLTISGIAIGTAITAALIRRQLKQVSSK